MSSSSNIEGVVSQVCNFIAYVGEFYSEGGIYDMGASAGQIADAMEILIERFGWESIAFDSVDRERIRDILIEDFGLVFPVN
jgi:hypothetical protein